MRGTFGRAIWRPVLTAAVVAAGLVSLAASPAASMAGTAIGHAVATLAAPAAQTRDVGDIAYADLLGGRVTFTQTEATTVRMSGQFNEGFNDPYASRVLYPGNLPSLDLRRDLDASINPPGASAFHPGSDRYWI